MGCALLDEAERVVVFLPPIFSVLLYDKPVPGRPTVVSFAAATIDRHAGTLDASGDAY